MEYLFYIQGVHAVRVTLDRNRVWDEVERYDLKKKSFVSDWSMIKRISNDMDCKKVSSKRFGEYIAFANLERDEKGSKPYDTLYKFHYFIQGCFALRLKQHKETKDFILERFDLYRFKFIIDNSSIHLLYDSELCTKVGYRYFWRVIAKHRSNMFSAN